MDQRLRRIILTTVCGLGALYALVDALGATLMFAHEVAFVAIAAGGVFAVQSMWASLRARQIDVNLLMVLAAIGAAAIGHPDDAAVLLFLFSLSSTLEAFALGKTKSAIEALMRLRPDSAVLLAEDGEREVPVNQLQAGDRIRVRPFDQVPVDAIVEQGRSAMDLSAMTGESEPVEVLEGSRLVAGTQNLDGALIAQVVAAVGDTTLDKIVALVDEAQEHRASGERISRWFGQWYTIFVLGAFCLSLVIRITLGNSMGEALGASLTLLVALSPCALVISVPATTLSAMAWGARNGLLIRGGEFLENAGRITTVALDKTGTLTAGKPRLRRICVHGPVTTWSGSGHLNEESRTMLRLAASAEQYSTHPVAEAIVRAARDEQIDVPEAFDHRVIPGLGIEARVDGQPVRIGQRRFFDDLPPAFADQLQGLHAEGMTVAVIQAGGAYAALGLLDEPRPESKAAVQAFRDLGIRKVAMMTGDNAGTAQAVGPEVGIQEIHAGLLPEDKTRLVAELEDAGERVMMVGDGVNDAPALTRATLGVAMGGLGSDVALNAADVVLMSDRVEKLPELIRLGRRCNRIIIANLAFAGGMIAVLTLTSAFARLPLPLAVLGHEGSTVLVILNGLRLLRGPGALAS